MKAKRKLHLGDICFEIFLVLFILIFVFVTLYPLINTLAISFNDGFDTVTHRIHFIPHQFTTDNYRAVFAKEGYRWGAVNTVLRTVLGTLISLVVNAVLAFVISRKRFLFKKSFSLFWVITMYVNGGLIPTFIVYQKLHLTNNFLVYIIPGAVSAFNMLVIRNFMNGIPESLEESAQIDGAGYFKIFYSIISPLCKPVYATIALFVAVYQWNSWFDAMLYNKMHDELTVLQYELMKQLQTAMKSAGSVEGLKYGGSTITPTSIRAAATICTMLPILFIYPFLQRYFVTGLTIGGVKE
ncbi:MAG: carbohydrate ABC transporter permease [Ruminococcaceae bacterium]|nr:carbohydrate ABC transporter permease [Oscillospiraceae bacterium]